MNTSESGDSALFILGLYGLELGDELGQGYALSPIALVTNNFREIRKHLHPGFKEAVGNIEWHSLEYAKAIIYSSGRVPPVESRRDDVEALNAFLHHVGVILNSFWLVKDNAVNFELGFMQLRSGHETRFHSNFLAATLSTATGLRPITRFSRHELRTASRLFQECLCGLYSPHIILQSEKAKGEDAPKLGSQRTVPRLTRVVYFLSGARFMCDLGSKIVGYVTALEVLFSTDSSELSHKVAHRVAVFLGSNAEEKLGIFAAVKKAYNIRSKVVHGDVLSKENVEQIGDVSQQVDDTLRKVLLKIFASPDLMEIFQGKKENLESYFLKSSFS